MTTKLFVQAAGMTAVELVEVEDGDPVGKLVEKARHSGFRGDSVAQVFIEDQDEALDLTRTVEEAGLANHASVHVATCPRVEVTVRYGGTTRSRTYSPAQRVEHVFKWATGKQGFAVDEEDALDLALQACGKDGVLSLEDHIGLFLTSGQCKACFDLVPTDRIQG